MKEKNQININLQSDINKKQQQLDKAELDV